MSERPKSLAPPYASFPTFLNFLNKLRDTAIPSRIDPTVFGNASGSISYSIIASLKFLKLISAEGVPTSEFVAFVKADDEQRKGMLADILQAGYPTLWNGTIDLKSATAGQFDEHIREEFESKGSTVDKVATFFLQAAKHAGVEISPHLAARKPIATSASAGKSKKQRQAAPTGDLYTAPPVPPAPIAKALEYQLIDLMKEEGIGEEEQAAIWTLVRFLTAKNKG